MTAGISTRLCAQTRAVDAPVDVPDMLRALGRDGFCWIDGDRAIITAGVAARVSAARALEALRAIDGDGAIACGALTFDRTADATLTIPARVLRIDGDCATVTEIEGVAVGGAAPLSNVPRRFAVEARQDLATWDAAVAAALGRIERGEVSKVVLAREVTVDADITLSPVEVLARLHTTQPGCFVYGDGRAPDRWFVGASPELLVRRRGDAVESRPMAGTVPRGASPDDDAAAVARLASSAKQRAEHGIVIDAVRSALARHCDDVTAGEPEAVRLTAVTHLATSVRARLRDGASALDLALDLHPTPAVGGTPTDAARAAIAALEGFDRGNYAAPVGWVDARGDGEFAVALRCAELRGAHARLLAGAGIVAGSDPDDEWAETQAKLEPMLRAIVRP
jgi:menaquinone-specific isochorismate synthase